MTKKQTSIVIAFGFLVLIGIALGVIFRGEKGMTPAAGPAGTATTTRTAGYTAAIPQGATASIPKNEAPASANPALDTKLKFFDLKASASGFSPSSITVNSGDSLQLSFTAADGDYDLDIPYLGAYFSVVKKGVVQKIPIDTSMAGTFTFQCRSYCPKSGQIKGQLIVLPKK